MRHKFLIFVTFLTLAAVFTLLFLTSVRHDAHGHARYGVRRSRYDGEDQGVLVRPGAELLRNLTQRGRMGGAAVDAPVSPIDRDIVWDGRIFVQYASFRDTLCHESVVEAFARAMNPERISMGIFQQHKDDEDPDCLLAVEAICDRLRRGEEVEQGAYGDEQPERLVVFCNAYDEGRIRIDRIDYMNATGPTMARHYAQAMLVDEEFIMQVDAHSRYVYGWDVDVLVQWRMTKNPRAVLATYPKDVNRLFSWLKQPPAARTDVYAKLPRSIADGLRESRSKSLELAHHALLDVGDVVPRRFWSRYGYNPNLLPTPLEVAMICGGKLLEDDMMKFHGASVVRNAGFPMLAPFWAAGFNFMSAEGVARVPYDPHTPYIFDGEEFSYAARLWTHGFDMYTPSLDVVFHPYGHSSSGPKYWQIDWEARKPTQRRSQQRLRYILGLPADYPPLYDIARFGMGPARRMADYLRFTNVSFDVHFTMDTGQCKAIRANSFWKQAPWPKLGDLIEPKELTGAEL